MAATHDFSQKSVFVKQHFEGADFVGVRFSPNRQLLMAEFSEGWRGTMLADTNDNGAYQNPEAYEYETVYRTAETLSADSDALRALRLAQYLIERETLTIDDFLRVDEDPIQYMARMQSNGRNEPALWPHTLKALHILARERLPETDPIFAKSPTFFQRLASALHLH